MNRIISSQKRREDRRDNIDQGRHRRPDYNAPVSELQKRLDPSTITEKLIISTIDTLKTAYEKSKAEIDKIKETNWRYKGVPTIPISECASSYRTLMNSRHDVWSDFLNDCKKNPNIKFAEKKFGKFCEELSECYLPGTVTGERIRVTTPDPSMSNKTPDILMYFPSTGHVYLGDIAVSVNYRLAEQRKTEKYYPLFQHLHSSGLRVVHQNFIIVDDLTNVEKMVKDFVRIDLISYNRNSINKAKIYHELADRYMRFAKENCSNPADLEAILRAQDQKADELILNLNVPVLEPYSPISSEEGICLMVKNETDRIWETYYDDGYNTAKEKFKDLEDSFNARPHMKPKAAIKVCHNSESVEDLSGHKLVMDYINDMAFASEDEVSTFCLNFLPSYGQLKYMMDKETVFESKEAKNVKVYGPWQYTRYQKTTSMLTSDFNSKLTRGKKNPNEKVEPKTIDPGEYDNCIDVINSMIDTLGKISDKPAFLDESWDVANNLERDNTLKEKESYDYCKSTVAAQLGNSLSALYQRMVHLKTKLSTKDNIFIPPNGSFICVIPSHHQPFNKNNADAPLIFLTRKPLDKDDIEIHESEHSFRTMKYEYHVSKLCRLQLDKLAYWDQAGHKIVACSSFLINLTPTLRSVRERVVGTIAVLTLDLHQKTSELLDLLKYVSFMPFSAINKLSTLIEDKFDIMLKTPLDVWVLKTIEDFMSRLGSENSIEAVKEAPRFFNGAIIQSSLGMDIKIPSFINTTEKHTKIQDFIEEISMLNIVRGKHYYGSQFMDKSLTLTAQWNEDYDKEVEKYGDWATSGTGQGVFPFESKFCYSADLIYYAQKYREMQYPVVRNSVVRKLGQIDYDTHIHHLCSLRGSTKEKHQRKNKKDLHTTAMDACLKYYRECDYDEESANIPKTAEKISQSDYITQYSMSEKDQRGGGRPIATPTLMTKVMNAAIEKPEQAIGTFTSNNILVAGKHKLSYQSKTYKEAIERGCHEGKKYIYQCTEDQTKFSENDNTRKYLTYIRCNELLPDDVRSLQYECMKKMVGREHLIKKIPVNVESDYVRHLNDDGNGIKAKIGWPQGMLNNISTSVHGIADYYSVKAYNDMYGEQIVVKGLIHSDDSWFAICCDNIDQFKRYTVFRMLLKRMMCLKLNTKKLWGSQLMGELVSNFNINGEVFVPVGKTVANSFGNLQYMNWPMDVHNQISALQQVYRQGGTIGTLVLMATLLRQQIFQTYNVSDQMKKVCHQLPIELGGYPNNSVFELGVAGVNCHYKNVYDIVARDPNSDISKVILRTLRLSMIFNKTSDDDSVSAVMMVHNELSSTNYEGLDDRSKDFDSVVIPKRGEVFSCIKHLFPKTNKISATVSLIKALPFEPSGLEQIITRPKKLDVALGNLKASTSNMLYELASDKYSQSKRRMAANQALQASGNTVKIAGFRPMRIEDVIGMILHSTVPKAGLEQLESSFQDDTNIVALSSMIVNYSTMATTGGDKRRVVNTMPKYEDQYSSIAPIRNVLLYIIDTETGSNHRAENNLDKDLIDIVISDAELFKKRFKSYFDYYEVKFACNLIMQQYYSRIIPRLWTQPKLRHDDLQNFLEDLYGRTINQDINYTVDINYKPGQVGGDSKVVQTAYTLEVLNELYPGKFIVETMNKIDIEDVLKAVDYGSLSEQELLMYGVLYKRHFDDNRFIEYYDDHHDYDHMYIKAQRMINGSYRGNFEVIIRHGTFIMKVVGEPGNFEVVTNRSSVQEMLIAMHKYVCQDHPDYRYNNPQSWSQKDFWQSKTKIGTLMLVNYGNNINLIKSYQAEHGGLAMRINPDLRYPVRASVRSGCDYSIDNMLRIVNRVTDNGNVRVGNIKQSMSCPLIEKVELTPEFIDGFLNTDLLKTKLIIDVTMHRSFTASVGTVRELLRRRQPANDNRPLMALTLGVIKKVFMRTFGDIDYVAEEIDHIDIQMEGTTTQKFFEVTETTAPESLQAIEMEYVHDDSERYGALIQHKNLNRFLCKCVSTKFTEADLEGLMCLIMADRELLTNIRLWVDDNNVEVAGGRVISDETIAELFEMSTYSEYLEDSVYIVLGNNLDILENVGRISVNRDKRLNRRLKDIVYKLKDSIDKLVDECITGEIRVDPLQEIIDNY